MFGLAFSGQVVLSKKVGEAELKNDKHGNPYIKLGAFIRVGKDETKPLSLFVTGKVAETIAKLIADGKLRQYATLSLFNCQADFGMVNGKPQADGEGRVSSAVYNNSTVYVRNYSEVAIGGSWGQRTEDEQGGEEAAPTGSTAADEIPF